MRYFLIAAAVLAMWWVTHEDASHFPEHQPRPSGYDGFVFHNNTFSGTTCYDETDNGDYTCVILP